MKKIYITTIIACLYLISLNDASAQYTVRWSDLINATTDNNGIVTKLATAPASWNNTSATSSNTLAASTDGSIEFTITNQVTVQIGFITGNFINIGSAVFTNALSVSTTGLISTYEGATTTSTYGNYTSGDVFKISREGANVKYYKNGSVFRTVTANTAQLWIRANIFNNGMPAPAVTASFDYKVLIYADVTGAGGTQNNGGAVVIPSGGKTPYTYSWSSSETTNAISGKAPGDYTVTVTDADGRTASQTIHIAYKAIHGFLKNVTQDNGSLTAITASGWNGTGSHPTNSPVTTGGWIEFTVKDYSSQYMIGFRNGEILTLSSCKNSIVISVDGTLYTYEGGVGTPHGKYRAGDVFRLKYDGTNVKYYRNGTEFRSVTATANAFYLTTVVSIGTTPRINCTSDANVVIQGIVNGKAHETATGSIETSILGGTPPFQYSWSSGETTSNITNKAAGVYTLTVTDAEYRQATQTFNLGYKSIWTNKTNVTANGNGFNRTASPSGANTTNIIPSGEPGYIEWVHMGNGNEYQVGFSAADHSMGLLDFYHSVSIPSSGSALTYESQTGAYLVGAMDGDVFRISRESNGNIKYYRNGVAVATRAGNFNDFELRAKFVITTGTAPAFICSHNSQLLPVATVVGASNSSANGSILMNVAGGNGTYSYSWVNSSNNSQGTSIDLTDKPKGAYTFTVSDTEGRSVSRTYEIGYRPKFTSNLMTIGAHSMTKHTSYGWDGGALSSGYIPANQDGWLEVIVPDATAYAVYRIGLGVGYSNYSIGSIAYGFEMTSARRINAVESGTGGFFGNILAGDVLRIERVGTELRYRRNGTLKRTITNVSASRELRWKAVVSTGPIPMVNTSFDSKINITADVVGVGLSNNNGAINLAASGGHGNYSYSWSNGSTTPSISGLAAGTYTVTVTDEESRSATATFLVGKRPTWTAPVGATLNPDQSLTKNVADAQTAGVLTVPSFTGDGWIQFTTPRTTGNYIIGFTATPSSYVQTTITHGIEVDAANSIVSTRSGATLTYLSSYQPGDVFRISREGTSVKYYRNGTDVRSATVSTSSSLRAQTILNVGTAPPVMSSFELDDIQVSVGNWGFQYKYDARKRMIGKKVPGADWVYMVYDDRDRLVLTQDGNQRAANQWAFTKYDELNRPVLTGIMDTTASILRQTMQDAVDLFYTKVTSTSTARWGETRGGTFHDYTNTSYPIITDTKRGLTVSYFDDYEWQSTVPRGSRFAFDDDQLIGEQEVSRLAQVVGMPTGSKVRVLDGGVTWLTSTVYYDSKGRIIQTISDNYKGGIDVVTNVLDFTGKVLKMKSVHNTADIAWKDKVALIEVGNQVSSKASAGWNNSGAASTQVLAANTDGWVEAMVMAAPTANQWILGMSNAKVDNLTSTIDFGIGVVSTGQTQTFENGTGVNRGVTVIGSVLRVWRQGNQVKFYRNDTLLHTATATSTSTLIADASLYGGSGFANATCSFCTTSQTTVRTMQYDHAGRLQKAWHQLNGGPNILLVTNEYNELGQLIDKKLHSDDNGATGRQSIDYRYNIRGWLTSMNGAELAANAKNADNGTQAKDLFGMDLIYNTVETGMGNTELFNGNISAMRWSNNLGLGASKENGYVYSYDAMNRFLSADFAQKTTSWQANSSQAYKEGGFTYDLNGNILTLTRKGKAGGGMDSLFYSYGTGNTRSNRLMTVEDKGHKATGFVDGTNTDNDYDYDLNGNMVKDQNKALLTGGITYNFLNLPETVTKGGNQIRYVYDATGRKLSQTAVYGTASSTTDYSGEHIYNDGRLEFIQHEEGRVVAQKLVSVFSNDCSTTTGMTNSTATLSAQTVGTEKYVRATSVGTAISQGIFPLGSSIPVVAGEHYRIRVKGYRSGTSPVYILAKVNGTINLGWPSSSIPSGSAAESSADLEVDIPTNVSPGAYLEVGVKWVNVTNGEQFFVNDVEVTRISNSLPEYQYNLKDHLGNVRLTFTTARETDPALATLEPSTQTLERSKFLRYDNARRVSSQLFDHTNEANLGASTTVYSNDFSSTISDFLTWGSVTTSLVSGQLKATNAYVGNHVYMVLNSTAGKNYKFTVDIDLGSAGDVKVRAQDATSGEFLNNELIVASNGTSTIQFTAQSSQTRVMITSVPSVSRIFYLDNWKVEDVSPAGNYAVRLNGSTNERYGLARSLSVMPGDTLNMEVWAKYVNTTTSEWTPLLAALISQIAGTTLPATRIDGSGYSTSTSSFAHGGLFSPSDDTGGPRAYLNWLVFNRDYVLVDHGYRQLSTAPMESGQDVAHERLFKQMVIAEAGYVYVYLSNDNVALGGAQVEVYFDDFEVEHIKSPVVSSQDYYSFGLTYNSYSRENSLSNQWKFQGQENVDELGLGWDSFKWRNHQPEIGRFFNVDPLAEKYTYNSPYAFSENHVTSHVELEGLEKSAINQVHINLLRSEPIQSSIRAANEGGGSMLKVEGGGQVAGVGVGAKAGPFSLGGNARFGAFEGSVAPGTSSGTLSAFTMSGGVSGPGTKVAGQASALTMSSTSSNGTTTTNSSVVSGSLIVELPTPGVPDQVEVSKTVDGATGSGNTNGEFSFSATIGVMWAKVSINVKGAGEFIKNSVQAIGDFIGSTAEAMANPDQSVVPQGLQEQEYDEK
jgi:RHS repeat-associated protein